MKPFYISLGGTCAISNNIKRKDNHITLVFDWCNISISQLNLVISNNFIITYHLKNVYTRKIITLLYIQIFII